MYRTSQQEDYYLCVATFLYSFLDFQSKEKRTLPRSIYNILSLVWALDAWNAQINSKFPKFDTRICNKWLKFLCCSVGKQIREDILNIRLILWIRSPFEHYDDGYYSLGMITKPWACPYHFSLSSCYESNKFTIFYVNYLNFSCPEGSVDV